MFKRSQIKTENTSFTDKKSQKLHKRILKAHESKNSKRHNFICLNKIKSIFEPYFD